MKNKPGHSLINRCLSLFFALMVLLISTGVYGADDFSRQKDSLLGLIRNKNTVNEAHIRCQLGSLYYRHFQFDEGLKQAKLALKTGIAKQDEDLMIRAHRLYADLYYAMARYELSLKHFEEELKIQERRKDERKIAEVHCNIGVIYDVRGYLEKGLQHYLEALKWYEKLDDKEGLVATLSNLAFIYKGQGQYRESIRYFERASQLESKYLQQQKPHYFLVNMAEDYVSLKQFDRAEKLLEKSESILLSLENADDEDVLIWVDQARIRGDIYLNTGRIQQAMKAYDQALELAQRSGYQEKEGPVLIRIGDLMEKTGRYKEADEILHRALDMAREVGSLSMQRYAYQKLAQVAEKQNLMGRAYTFLKLYTRLNDSIISRESALRMSDMRALYEAQQKESRIKLLVQENKIQLLRAQKNKNRLLFLILIALFLMLVIGLIHARYREKVRTGKLLQEKNVQLMDLNATKDKFFTIIAHDLKNPVTSFQRISQNLDMNLEVIKPADLRYFMQELSSSAGYLNQLLGNLLQWARSQRNQIRVDWAPTNPGVLIRSAWEDVATSAGLKRIGIRINNPDNPTLITDRNIVVTVLRNILSNAIKFSPENTSVNVSVSGQSREIVLMVEDQGPGIKPEVIATLFKINMEKHTLADTQKTGTGLGLILCAEILQKIHGRIWVESEPGKGSRFFVLLPESNDFSSG